MLEGKKIILGITGSIAAYKSAYLLRLLIKEKAEVQVIMTRAAKQFITPVTMSALSGKPVLGEFFETSDGTWHSHVDLGLWADLMLIAPASANTMGKMAAGICDNLLLTTYLSAKCPVMVAPAMDLDMFRHPANQKNIKTLTDWGAVIVEPGTGELASGLCGKGRMEEPDQIIEKIKEFFASRIEQPLKGKKVLITAGPTYEKLDPVRFIGNYSSGKMGFAIAEEAARRGAEVTLVSGPVKQQLDNDAIKRIDVESAAEMKEACEEIFPEVDAAIMSAAVADYTPKTRAENKMKRKGDTLMLELVPTTDIAAMLGGMKQDDQVLAGFALETNDAIKNAFGKLKRKNLDFIVLNSLEDAGAGFMVDTNKISIIDRENKIEEFPLKTKREVAADIVDRLMSYLK
jgi:phosphopantothenoylcysteine decarboxylase/phosphopantothenate--cysteine ligase